MIAWHLPLRLIVLAVIADLVLGDPRWLPHPVRLIGCAIDLGERLAWTGDPQRDLRRGAALAVAIVAAAIAVTCLAIWLASLARPAFGALVAMLIAWTTLAMRSLDRAAAAAQRPLQRGDLCAARAAMPSLVGRDPQSLDRDGMIRATVESLAESCCDGVIAPLFYLLVGGPAAAIAYKAINTLDSMIGRKDERYIWFGRWAARMDDVANLLPARLTAGCLIAAAAVMRLHPRDALRVCRADARRHPSPNSGFPEAAMAGALGLQLGGPAIYGGELEMRPYLGVAQRAPRVEDIAAARKLIGIAAAAAFALIAVTRLIIESSWAG